MIIAVARINRNVATILLRECRKRVAIRPVIRAEHDNTFHIGPECAGRGAASARFLHIIHVTRVARAKPCGEPFSGLGRGVWPRDAAKIEAKLARFRRKRCLEIARQKSRSA
jgi:hypothetical protein